MSAPDTKRLDELIAWYEREWDKWGLFKDRDTAAFLRLIATIDSLRDQLSYACGFHGEDLVHDLIDDNRTLQATIQALNEKLTALTARSEALEEQVERLRRPAENHKENYGRCLDREKEHLEQLTALTARSEALEEASTRTPRPSALCVGGEMISESAVSFTIPLLPPSVNHYVTHQGGKHFKSAEAKAWERDFPLFSKGQFVNGETFMVTIILTPGAKQKGDIDNYSKLVLDCIAKAGMLRNLKGQKLTDAAIKSLHIELIEDRKNGPKTEITIERLT